MAKYREDPKRKEALETANKNINELRVRDQVILSSTQKDQGFCLIGRTMSSKKSDACIVFSEAETAELRSFLIKQRIKLAKDTLKLLNQFDLLIDEEEKLLFENLNPLDHAPAADDLQAEPD